MATVQNSSLSAATNKVFLQIDTEALKELVLDNKLIHDFFCSLPLLELYLDYVDKRVTKCKASWLEFYRSFKDNSFGRVAAKMKDRDTRTGSMNPDDYQDSLCTDLLSLLVYSKMSNELLDFIQNDLKDTDKLSKLHENTNSSL